MKLFAVGDIHGNYKALTEMLNCLNRPKDSKLIFLGDYIDRGPESFEVLEKLISIKNQAVILRGNHEEMLAYCQSNDDGGLWLYNGGYQTLQSYKINTSESKVTPKHLYFIAKLPLCLITKNYIFVHAGLKPHVSLKDQDEESMLWIREDFIHSTYDWGKRVVFGHTIQWDGPIVKPNKIGIDTGCYKTGNLTVVELDDDDPNFIKFHTFVGK